MAKIPPTQRQRRAAELMVENGGIASRAMLEAGYSPNTAKTPSKMTDSESFQELLTELLPDNRILGALGQEIFEGKIGYRTPAIALAAKIKGWDRTNVDVTSGGMPLQFTVTRHLHDPDPDAQA